MLKNLQNEKRTYKKPLITMGLATYQGEKFIKKSLISILNQTYKNTEIIICDDNSNDKTLEICKSICKKRDVKILKNLKISERKKRNKYSNFKYCKGGILCVGKSR